MMSEKIASPPRPHFVREFTPRVAMADVATAFAVAFTASIPISIIDYSIMARVAGVTNSSLQELWRGTKTLFLRPHRFFLPCAENKCSIVFGVCFTVYSVTYIASNMAKSYFEAQGFQPDSANLAAGAASSLTNTIASMWKDGVILKSLPPVGKASGSGAPKPVPWLTRGLFCCRDTITCVAAFTLAPMIATWLAQYCYHQKKGQCAAEALDAAQGKIQMPLSNADLAQIGVPALLQFVTTIPHIVAIRYRQTYPKWDFADLRHSFHQSYMSSTALRMCRIIPAFGIGGIMNREMRWSLLDRAEPVDLTNLA